MYQKRQRNIGNKISFGRTMFQILLVFGFIYEVQPIGVPDLLTSRKLVFYLAALLFLYKRRFKFYIPQDNPYVSKIIKKLMVLSIAILLWVIFLCILNSIGRSPEGKSIFSRTLLFVPFTSFIYLFMYDLFDNTKQFMFAAYIATLLQSVIVISDYFSQSVKVFLYNHFVLDANFSYLSPYRAAGLGAGESLLSMYLLAGMVAGAYFILISKHISIYILGYMVILFAAFLSGSTGFLAGAILFVAITVCILVEARNFKGPVIFVVSIMAFGFVISILPDFFSKISDFEIFRKISDLWKVGVANSSIVTSLQAQEVAPITPETIIGTGIIRGYSARGAFSRSDTGYLQAYFGYGLIGAVSFYFFLYKNMLTTITSLGDKKLKILMFLFFIVNVAGEAKEPYIHHYGIIFVFYMACLLWHKENTTRKFRRE